MAEINKVIVAEFGIAVAMQSYAYIKDGYLPWPASFMRSALGFSALALLEMLASPLGALIGAGMLIVLFVRNPGTYTKAGSAGSYVLPATMYEQQYMDKWLLLKSSTPPASQGGDSAKGALPSGDSAKGSSRGGDSAKGPVLGSAPGRGVI